MLDCPAIQRSLESRHSSELSCLYLYMAVDITDDENFAAVLDHHIKIDMTTTVQTALLTTIQLKLAVDFNTLAWCWDIPLHKAKKTVQCTTQHFVGNIANPTLVCTFFQQFHAPILSIAPYYLYRLHVCQYQVQVWQQMCSNIQVQFWMVVCIPYEDERGGTQRTVHRISA